MVQILEDVKKFHIHNIIKYVNCFCAKFAAKGCLAGRANLSQSNSKIVLNYILLTVASQILPNIKGMLLYINFQAKTRYNSISSKH